MYPPIVLFAEGLGSSPNPISVFLVIAGFIISVLLGKMIKDNQRITDNQDRINDKLFLMIQSQEQRIIDIEKREIHQQDICRFNHTEHE